MFTIRMKKVTKEKQEQQEPEYHIRRISKPREVRVMNVPNQLAFDEKDEHVSKKPKAARKLPKQLKAPKKKVAKSSRIWKPKVVRVTPRKVSKAAKVNAENEKEEIMTGKVMKSKIVVKKDSKFVSLDEVSFKRSTSNSNKLSPIKDVLRHSKVSKFRAVEEHILVKKEIKTEPDLKSEETELKNVKLEPESPQVKAEPIDDHFDFPAIKVNFENNTDKDATIKFSLDIDKERDLKSAKDSDIVEESKAVKKFYSESECEKFERKAIYQDCVLKYRYKWIPETDRQVFHIPRGLTPTQLVAVEQFAYLIRNVKRTGKVSVRVRDNHALGKKGVKRNFSYHYVGNMKSKIPIERIDNCGAIGLIFF